MIYSALSQFYLTPEEVEASPSRADGVSAEMEDNLRRFGCDQIQRAVVLLDLPQVVAVTAQILLHRFYTRRSLKQFEVRSLSTAALWLAAKLEEVVEIDRPDHLRLRDVVMVCHRLSQRASGVLTPDLLDPNSMTYAEIKAAAVRDERHLLRALGFVIAVEQPHRFVLNYGALVLDASPQVQQEAWNLANDALRTTLCLTLRPEAIACGILFLAARRLGIPLPEDPPWWLPLGASTEEVHHVASTLCALYRKPAPEYVSLRDPPKRSPFAAASHSLHDADARPSQTHKEDPDTARPKSRMDDTGGSGSQRQATRSPPRGSSHDRYRRRSPDQWKRHQSQESRRRDRSPGRSSRRGHRSSSRDRKRHHGDR